jgi:prepilin-type N-terminal cleavage/methylation domain-containing protein
VKLRATNHKLRIADGHAKSGSSSKVSHSKSRHGFTLLEVMIASGIFFICVFAILQLLSVTLRNAHVLQRTTVDAGSLAMELSLTNQLSEGTESGDFGDLYSDYNWTRDITQIGTNGLFQADFVVYRRGISTPESRLSVLYFKPQSQMRGPPGPR